jgi:hypothetical protein
MHHSEFHIERIKELPDEVYLHTLGDIHKQQEIRLKAEIKHQKEIKRINDEYQNEIHSLIGKENLPVYQRLNKRRMKDMSHLRKNISKSRDGLIKFENKRLYYVEEARKLLKKSGIDENKLRAVQKAHSEKIENAFSNRISLMGRIPKPQPRELKSEWVELKAPFHDYEIDTIEARSTKGPDSFDYNVECDNVTGRMKHESWIHVRDAGDSEDVDIKTIAWVGKLVRMPPGCSSLTVLASFNNIRSFARGYYTEEWGFFKDCLICSCTVAAVRVVRIWPVGGSTDTIYPQIEGVNGGVGRIMIWEMMPHAWDFDFWESGEQIYADPAPFPGPYNGGDYIAVWVGLWSGNYACLNDYGVTHELTYQLKLDGIFVHFR